MPRRFALRAIRQAISPRLAIRTDVNMVAGLGKIVAPQRIVSILRRYISSSNFPALAAQPYCALGDGPVFAPRDAARGAGAAAGAGRRGAAAALESTSVPPWPVMP